MRALRRIDAVCGLGFWILVGLAPPVGRAATLSTVYTIPRVYTGVSPQAALTKLGDTFYGTTYGGGGPSTSLNVGTVFSINLKTGDLTTLYRFGRGADGGYPSTRLLAFDGKLYGTSVGSGFDGSGVVFSIDPATGAEINVASLPQGTGTTGALVEYGGLLYVAGNTCSTYGTNAGCVFSVDPDSGQEQVVAVFPSSAEQGYGAETLIRHGDALYGVAPSGGEHGSGTLFKLDPKTKQVSVLYSFGSKKDAGGPVNLIDVGETLYGTASGGPGRAGTVFSFDLATRKEAVVHGFSYNGTDGNTPRVGLLSFNGLLYGTTAMGGASGIGVLFSIDPASGQETVVHSFTYAETGGGTSFGELVEAHGLLYGTLPGTDGNGLGSGVARAGLIYAVDPATGTFSQVRHFAGSANPTPFGLTKVASNLYGAAASGGSYGLGSIFRVNTESRIGETVHSFDGKDGGLPSSALLEVGGILYGTTSRGGTLDGGTLFSFDPKRRNLTTLASFDQTTGIPASPLTIVGDAIYGTTAYDGGAGTGAVFSYALSTGRFSTLAKLTKDSGLQSTSGLVPVDGTLYGTAPRGGAYDLGAIYRLDLSTNSVAAVHSFSAGDDGAEPAGGLLCEDGLLYGSTNSLGRPARATIFAFDSAALTKTITRYIRPVTQIAASLTARGSKLYGTFESQHVGSTRDDGGVLETDPASGTIRFSAFTDGISRYPTAPLVLTKGGALWGTAQAYDAAVAGTVFRFVP